MIKLRIAFDNFKFGNICGETLWATELKNGTYRLENEPLHDDYEYGDIVRAEEVDGQLEVKSLVVRQLH